MAREASPPTPQAAPGSGSIGSSTLLLTMVCLVAGGCGNDPTASPPAEPAPVAESAASDARRGYEIPIPQIEYWEGSDRVLKFSYEMRFDAPGPNGRPALHRNGWARAYYASGTLEREGAYQWIPARGRSERVGRWTYFDAEGNVARVEDRGGDPIWTGPDQTTPPPGTGRGASG